MDTLRMHLQNAIGKVDKITPTSLVLGILFLLHLSASFYFFPPTEVFRAEPLYTKDYPVHTHRVHVYREALFESGLPWGYDPDVSAGSVMSPSQDIGAKPLQVLGILLPFLPAGTVVRLFLFLTLLTFPIWTFLACRRLGFSVNQQIWILIVLLAVTWLEPRITQYWRWGLVGFLAASYFSVYVLAVFLDYLKGPKVKTYVLFCLVSSLLFLLHVVGPVAIFPALVAGIVMVPALRMKQRMLLVLVPVVVIVLNAFWLIPFLLAERMPQLPVELSMIPPDRAEHLTHTSWNALASSLLRPGVILLLVPGVIFAIYGFFVVRRTVDEWVARAIGATVGFGLFLMLFGSFIPVVARMQPSRFVIPTTVFLSILVGVAIAAALSKIRFPVKITAVALVLVLAAGGTMMDRLQKLDLLTFSDSDPLIAFIQNNTDSGERLLIQSQDGYRYGHYETKVYPISLQRQVIGSNFPEVTDAPQFLNTYVLGQVIEAWSPDELREALVRWGGSWAFTRTPEAHELFETTLGEPVADLGRYRAFQIRPVAGRFLHGTGMVRSQINRIELTQLQPEDELIVLRYRYHPGWRAESDVPVYRYSADGNPSGFIALKNPPESITLRMNPWAMLREPWVDPVEAEATVAATE